MNKYQKWYNSICERGRTRITEEYTERHHIVPESFYKIRKRKGPAGWLEGDSDASTNITRLTDREHELAHYLLTKIHKNNKRAYFKTLKGYEMRSMVNPNQEDKRHFSSRRLAGIRAERARIQSEEMKGEGNPNYGKNWTEEQKEEQRKKVTGRKQTQEALDNLQSALDERRRLGLKRKGYSDEYKEERRINNTGSLNPMFGRQHKEESKELQRKKATGRVQSEETKKKKADKIRGSKREKKLCPHCNKHIAVNTYPRFHGDNCDQNPKSPRFKPNLTKTLDFS